MAPIDFAAVFESAPSAVMLVDREYRYVAVSREYTRLVGSRREDLIGRTVFEAFPQAAESDNTSQVRSSFDRVIASKQRDVLALIHYRVPRGEGLPPEDRYWSAVHTPVLGADGEVLYIQQQTSDVTELQRLRERTGQSKHEKIDTPTSMTAEANVLGHARELQAVNETLGSELQNLRSMFDQAPGFMCFLRGPHHVFELYNAAYLRLIGDRPLLGLTVRDAVPEVASQGYWALLDRVYNSGVAFLGHGMRIDLASSAYGPAETRIIDFVYQPIFGADRQVIGIFVQGNDITEQKRLESEREQLAALVQQSSDLIAVAMPDLQLQYVNDAGLRMVGRASKDVATTRLLDCFPVADALFVETTVLPHVRERDHWNGELRLKTNAESGSIAAYCTLFALRDERRELQAIAMVCRDISAEKARDEERTSLLEREQGARADAEHANRLKDEFLATVSHELRTPLTAMLGWVHMMRGGQLSTERSERALETIERNARAQAQLIDDLLDVSRIMSGKLLLTVAPVSVASIVDAALDSARPAADAKRISLHPVLDSRAQVMGDAGRLQQIIWNLLSNAVKFTPAAGRVRVLVEQIGSHVHITVADNGQGIAEEFLPHVFERFRQEEGSITRRHGGLGLGLAIVKHLVELHGGAVSVQSDGPGKGTSFTVRLPVALAHSLDVERPKREGMSAVEELPCPPELDGLHVFVVEDERDTRELLSEILVHCGAKVDGFESASLALAAFVRERPAVLLSDIGMPNDDGYALIKKVRALPANEGGRTPAIALTAFARAEDRTRALRAGFNAHVPKPIDFAELVAVIASIVPRTN